MTDDIRLPDSPMSGDINHPRSLLLLWREEADTLIKHASAAAAVDCTEATIAVFESQAGTLRHCADQLESRLLWSGL